MRNLFSRVLLGGAAVSCLWQSVEAAPLDGSLREAAPNECYLAIHGWSNPERDYQKAYHAAVMKEIEDTQIIQRVFQLIQSRLSEGDAEQFVQGREMLLNAVAPIQWDKVTAASEVLYCQQMSMPVTHHLMMARMPEGGADSLVEALTNLMTLAENASKGEVGPETLEISGVQMTEFVLPPQAPMNLMVGSHDGIFIFCTSSDLLAEGLRLLANPSETSKFDDPRVAEALSNLPEAEDSMIFFDGKMLFSSLKQIPNFIRAASRGDEDAARAAIMLEELFGEVAAVDYELTVEYTDGYQNRAATFGKAAPGAGEMVLGKMVGDQQPFESWGTYVPETATAFTLQSGINLHPLYEWAMAVVPKHFPEAQQGLDQFAAMQDQIDIHLDADILQSFSGESVSITLPGKSVSMMGPVPQSIFAMRCSNPDRISELIHRGMDELTKIPDVQKQGIGLKPVDGMEGFDELTANMMGMIGMRPVIGFQDGWMVMASHKEAVSLWNQTLSGEAPPVSDAELFTQFEFPVDGPVSSISYANTGEQTRQMAQGLSQVGMMMPMILGMAGQGGNAPDLSGVQDVMALLPSVGRILAKMDFMESRLSVTQPVGDDTYRRDVLVMIRPPKDTEE